MTLQTWPTVSHLSAHKTECCHNDSTVLHILIKMTCLENDFVHVIYKLERQHFPDWWTLNSDVLKYTLLLESENMCLMVSAIFLKERTHLCDQTDTKDWNQRYLGLEIDGYLGLRSSALRRNLVVVFCCGQVARESFGKLGWQDWFLEFWK